MPAVKKGPEKVFNPVRLLIILVISIILADVLVRIFILSLPKVTLFQELLLDSILVAAILFPILYFMVFRPLARSLTERRIADEAFIKEKYLMEAMMNSLPDHIYFKDSESRFIRNSMSHVKSFGMNDPAGLIGKSDFDFFAEEAARQAFNDEQEIIRTGIPVIKEERLVRKDGTVAWFSAMKLPLIDESGKSAGTFGISRDITEKKKAEEALIQSEERFRSVTMSAIDAVISSDDHGIILGWNPAAEKSFGFKESEIMGQPLDLIIPGEFLAMHREGVARVSSGGEKHVLGKTVELKGRKKDGQLFPIELSLSEWIQSGKIYFTAIIRDITNRKRTELENMIIYEIAQGINTTSNLDELLNLIHQELGKAVYAENCFVALKDEKTGLFSFPLFVDKFDPTPEPVSMGKSCSAYVFRKNRPFLFSQEDFDNLVEKDEVEQVGTASPSWIGIPLRTPSKVIGVLVLQHYEVADVYSENDMRFLESVGSQIAISIERKQVEAALIKSERALAESQKIAGLGSYNLSFMAATWSSSDILDSIFGIDSSYNRSIDGWIMLIHPDWREAMSRYLMKNVMVDHESFDREYKIVRVNDGQERWVHGKGELSFDGRNELVSMIGTVMDITLRKLAEEEIKIKNELLQIINAEKDKFFSIIAHDLRGPLSSFVAATQIITEEIQSMTLEEIKDITMSMKVDASNIYTLLENLLEWSRLKRNTMDFVIVKFGLRNKIESSLKVIYGQAIKKEIEIRITVPDDIEISADDHMFDTVIRNLVSNAVKFTPKGGSINVSALRDGKNDTQISISDSGIGMSPDLINKLFILNEKTNRKGTDGEPSSGLGLLLCKEFIEKHNGKIWAESQEGKGSTFRFTLP